MGIKFIAPITGMLGVFLGFVLNLLSDRLKRSIWGPLLSLSVDNGPGCAAHTFYSVPGNPRGKYLRIRVKNVKDTTAEDVVVFLTKIEFRPEADDRNAAWQDIGFADALQLPWSALTDGFTRIPLPFGPDFYVDLISSSSATTELCPQWKLLNRYESLISQKGAYRFHIIATSRNGSIAKDHFIALWTGDWEQLSWKV